MRRTFDLLRAVALPAVLLLGTPTVLVPLSRAVLPEHRPTAGELAAWTANPLTPAGVATIAVLGGWSIWLCVVACVLTRARIWLTTGRRLPRMRLPAPLHTLAAAVAGAAAVTAAGTDAAAANGANAVLTESTTPHEPAHDQQRAPADNDITPIHNAAGDPGGRSTVAVRTAGTPTAPAHPPAHHEATGSRRTSHGRTVVVSRADTLWDIAARHLGDAHRWPHIYHLNRDRYDTDGHMRGGQHIEPGWRLRLPHATTATDTVGKPSSRDRAAVTTPTPPTPTPIAPQHREPATTPTTPATAAVTPPVTALPQHTSDDGVTHPSSPAAPAEPGPAAAGRDPAPTHTTPTPHPQAEGKPGISLAGGGWMDLGLASAVLAAVALVWAHRRRRYTPRPPSPRLRLNDPDLAPMPPVIAYLRRVLRRPAPATPITDDADFDNDVDDLHPVDESDGQERAEPGQATPGPAPGPHRWVAAGPASDDGRVSVVPAQGNPLTAVLPPAGHGPNRPAANAAGAFLTVAHTIGDRHGGCPPVPPVVPALRNPSIEAWPPAGLGLTGTGADAAARGFLTAALAAGGLDDPDARNWVITPATTIATLLGAAAVTVPDTPRLTVTGTLTDALELLEEQTLHRTRLLYSHEVDTVAALRVADPDAEPLPPILLIADANALHERVRIAALLTQGQRLDIHGVLLGAWPDGNTVVVDADGTTTPAAGDTVRHGHHPADVGRLTVLNPADLLTTLAESHTGRPQPPAPTEPAPLDTTPSAAATATAGGAAPGAEPGAGPTPAHDTADTTTTAPAVEAPTTNRATLGATPAQSDDDPDADSDAERADEQGVDLAEQGSGIVEVNLLGPPTIVGAAHGLPERKKSLELLVYLAAHNGSAAQQTIINDVLADAPRRRASTRLHTYVYDLHKTLKSAAGQGTYLEHPRPLYVLNTEALDVDLWHLRDALAAAGAAADPAARVAALRRVVDTYTGPLADGCAYEWIEPYRHAVHRQVLDAHLALADALTTEPEQALEILDKAMRHDPYAEPVYQAAMRAQAAHGDVEAIRHLRRTLTRRLDEIDTEPTDDTTMLAERLIADVQRRIRRSGARRQGGTAA